MREDKIPAGGMPDVWGTMFPPSPFAMKWGMIGTKI